MWLTRLHADTFRKLVVEPPASVGEAAEVSSGKGVSSSASLSRFLLDGAIAVTSANKRRVGRVRWEETWATIYLLCDLPACTPPVRMLIASLVWCSRGIMERCSQIRVALLILTRKIGETPLFLQPQAATFCTAAAVHGKLRNVVVLGEELCAILLTRFHYMSLLTAMLLYIRNAGNMMGISSNQNAQ